MRALKVVGIVLGALVALIAILLLAVRLFVDPNDYKDRIAAAVRNSTGRELILSGPIKLSVFPWIALAIGPASLGNPPGFGAEPFASVRRVALRVRLLPLLRKQLQIGRIEIDGLDLRLRKNAAGKANWQDFGGKGAASEASARGSSGSLALPDLGGVGIKDSRISYQDLVAENLNVELGHVAPGTPAPLRFRLDLKTSAAAPPMGLSGRLSVAYGGNSLSAKDIDIQLDDSRLRGSLAVTNLQTNSTGFDLAIDHIDLDRYRGPQKNTAAKPPEKAAEPSGNALESLRMNGTLTIGSAKVAGVNLTQVLVTLAAKDGVMRIAPVKAKLYGGDYSGDITLDERGATPDLKLDQSMTGIDMAHLLEDFAKSRRVAGRGSITTHLTAHSLGGDALMRSLNGHIAANVDNGAIEGVDLWFEINRAVALIQKQPLPAGQSSGRTKFEAFKASADLINGIASTKDLYIASRNLQVTGEGTTNLITNAIAYRLQATILKEASGSPGATARTLADIPLDITGTVTSPAVRPDLQALAKARVQEELDKHKGELQQKLMDKLKDIFK